MKQTGLPLEVNMGKAKAKCFYPCPLPTVPPLLALPATLIKNVRLVGARQVHMTKLTKMAALAALAHRKIPQIHHPLLKPSTAMLRAEEALAFYTSVLGFPLFLTVQDRQLVAASLATMPSSCCLVEAGGAPDSQEVGKGSRQLPPAARGGYHLKSHNRAAYDKC